ncbi:MAG TPA: TraB/GumN family protein, partial [Gammaproteobacteria bacterium]|nr:TraB/GumN family protein [Gammaproteobacteria bacterium]
IYAQADSVVFEIDLDDVAPNEVQSQFMGAAMLPGGASLQDVLEPALFSDTEAQAAQFGVDVRLLARFEPWFVATMLMSFGLSELGYEPRFGIEQYVLARSRRDGKEVNGIESLSTQVAVFDLLSEQDQAAFLEQTIAELGSDSRTMAALVSAWRNGALGELQSELMADFARFPGLYERLVVDRNAAWTEALEPFFAREATTAVVVGALHLVGDQSVIEMLRDRGYTITSVQ